MPFSMKHNIPAELAMWGGEKVANRIRGDDNQKKTSTNNVPTTTPVKSQVETFNKRYPWFNESDYNRLVEIADSTWKTWTQKDQLMDELYQYYYPQVLNHHKLDERQEVINNWVYSNGENLANWDRETNLKYRLISLSQMAKQKFDIAYNVSDVEVVNALTNDIENGKELLTKYLNNWDTELLYATWIYDKWEEAPDLRSQKDIAKETLWENYWKNVWDKMYTNSFAPLDSWEKKLYTLKKNMKNHVLDAYAGLVGQAPKAVQDYILWDMTYEEFMKNRMAMKEEDQKKIDNYINLVNETTNAEREKRLNPEMDNYYNRRNFTDLLAEWDIKWFFYKAMWDSASNWDMPVIIWTSVVNPAAWTALMWTNSYVRESQEAYETMRNAWATHEQAEIGWSVVGLVNTAIEIYLDKALWWVESTSSKWFREALKKNVMEEVQKKPFEEIVASASKKYVQSSLEEWLEEWLQNLVTNAAEMTVKENPEWKDLFEWGRASFEGWVFNPMNIVSWFSDVAQNKESLKQSMLDWATEAWYMARNITDTLGITKDWTVNTESTEMVTPQWTETTVDETIDANNPLAVYQQWEITKLNNSIKDANNPMANMDRTFTTEDWDVIELIDDEDFDWFNAEDRNWEKNTSITQKNVSSWDTAMDWLDENTRERIRRNPYAIQKAKEVMNNLKDNPWFDFLDWQTEEYENMLDVILEKLDEVEKKRSKDVGGLYDKLEEANTPIDTSGIKEKIWDYKTSLEDMVDELSNTDRSRIEKILDMLDKIWDDTTAVWKIRKKIDSFKKWNWATSQWVYFLKQIRKDIDAEIAKQNPEMKEVDKEYIKVLDEIRKLQWDIVYKKTWEAKNNAVSTVKNMLNQKNRLYLNTLEKYIPWIKEQLQWIRDAKIVFDAYTTWNWSRFTWWIRKWVSKALAWVGWAVVWAIFWWPVGFAAGWVIWDILFESKIDSALKGTVQKALEKTVGAETAESKAELERINKKIEDNQRLEAEEKAKLRELWDRIMQKMATMEKTDAEQSAWNNWLADLEQDEVIDMPEEVYDQWEEVTTTPKKKTTKKKTGKRATSKKKS